MSRVYSAPIIDLATKLAGSLVVERSLSRVNDRARPGSSQRVQHAPTWLQDREQLRFQRPELTGVASRRDYPLRVPRGETGAVRRVSSDLDDAGRGVEDR